MQLTADNQRLTEALQTARAEVAHWELRYEHGKMQAHADGFQTGWHAVIRRLSEGDKIDDLRDLVPVPVALRTAGEGEGR